MIFVKCFYENGDIVLTNFNGTIQDAEKYYIGNIFNIGCITDNLQKCVKIEVLEV